MNNVMFSVMASTGLDFLNEGSFLGEWWDPGRSSETSVSGVVILGELERADRS